MNIVHWAKRLLRTDAAQAATKGRSLDHIGFEVKDLEAFTKKLAADGVTLDVRDLSHAGRRLAFSLGDLSQR